MARFRTAVVGACVVLAALSAGACRQVSEQLNDRTLACGEVPEDVCVRLADDISAGYEKRNAAPGAIVRVTLTPRDCYAGLPAVRCWLVEATTAGGAGSSAIYYQRADGTLVDARDDSAVGG